MILRLFAIFLLSALCNACNSEVDSNLDASSFETAVVSFSDAVSTNSTSKFVQVASSEGVYLVRKFASGNLGGRGEELSSNISASLINNQMEIPVKGQTPVNLKILFPELPIKAYQKLPQYKFSNTTKSFDQWTSDLTKALADAPESVNGDPVILVSSDYLIYGEAQIIDGILVGGFAVFKKEADHFPLISIIELL